MKDYQMALCCVGFYCAMIAITYGYVLDRNDCYVNPSKYDIACGEGPIAKATIWPIYWIYHSGTLLFEPNNIDD